MAHDLTFVIEENNAYTTAHLILSGEAVVFTPLMNECAVWFSTPPDRTDPKYIPYDEKNKKFLLKGASDGTLSYKFIFDSVDFGGRFQYFVGPPDDGGKALGAASSGHTVIVGGVGMDGK